MRLLKELPVYFSLESGAEGVSRKETADDLVLFRSEVGRDPIFTPSIVQRLDFHPVVSLPLTFAGWSVTATAGVRGTYYSNSFDPVTQLVTPRDVVRGYGEFELDVRPPALARNFHRGDGSVRFRHVIEPYITYRRIAGIDDFHRIIRFDYVDAIANTNEIEFGLTNRFFTRRSTENVGPTAARLAREKKDSLATQPYEALTITVRGKYFFDRFFGGALIPGQRNQFYPINTFSGFSYGGVPRRFSPLNIDARYRPTQHTFADFRSDLDTRGGGLRALSATFGFNRTAIIEAFSTFYYTRAVELVPSLRQFANPRGRSRERCGARNGARLYFLATVNMDYSAASHCSSISRSIRSPASARWSVRPRRSATPGSAAPSPCSTSPSIWHCGARTARYSHSASMASALSVPSRLARDSDKSGKPRRFFAHPKREDLNQGSLAVTRPNHYNGAL